jgi:hypothetical protein
MVIESGSVPVDVTAPGVKAPVAWLIEYEEML